MPTLALTPKLNPGFYRVSTIRKNPAPFFILLVLVVVLDCFPRQVDRGDDDDHEHDQEKSRLFLIVLVLVVVLDCFPRRVDRGRRRARARSGKIPPLLYRARPRRRARFAFLASRPRATTTPRARSGKIPPFLYRARPRRRARLLSSPGRSRATTSKSTIRKNPASSLSCASSSSCSICFPLPAERGRRRPRARSGKIPPLLYRARPRRDPQYSRNRFHPSRFRLFPLFHSPAFN